MSKERESCVYGVLLCGVVGTENSTVLYRLEKGAMEMTGGVDG